jgi:hypothetical protein
MAPRGGRWLVLVLCCLLIVACTGVLPSDIREASGTVTSVDGPNAAQVDVFTLRTPDGAEIEFAVGELRVDRDAFPAAHLSEHLVSLEPVRVQYVERDGRNVALRVSDAPAP